MRRTLLVLVHLSNKLYLVKKWVPYFRGTVMFVQIAGQSKAITNLYLVERHGSRIFCSDCWAK